MHSKKNSKLIRSDKPYFADFSCTNSAIRAKPYPDNNGTPPTGRHSFLRNDRAVIEAHRCSSTCNIIHAAIPQS